MKKEEIPVTEFKEDEPRFCVNNSRHEIWMQGQVTKINNRIGNDIDGWRYEVEYKNGEKRYPPTFMVEARTEEEWNNQPRIPYEPHTWKGDSDEI